MGKGKAIGSLVCGILALYWPIAIVFGTIALCLGISVHRQKKREGRGMAIAGIVTGGIGLLILIVIALLGYLGALSPEWEGAAAQPQREPIVDTGVQVAAGNTLPTNPLSAGRYEIEITSDDAVTINTYGSRKDMNLHLAGGDGAEAYQDCSATRSIRFRQTCTVAEGAVVAVTNPNFFESINVNVKITRVA